MKIRSATIQNWIVPVAALVAWEIFGRAGMLPRYLSLPSAILAALWELAVSGELLVALAASLYRVSTGFVLGTVAGVIVGLGAGIVPGIRHFFDPLVSFLYSIPKIAFLPVFLLLFGLGHASKIAIIAFSGFFPVFIASRHAVLSVNKLLIWTAQNMGTPERKIFFRVIIPAAAPQLFSGIRIGLAHAFVVLFAAELIGSKVGLGTIISSRRGMGAVRPDVRRHRLLRRARFRERPHPAGGARARAQGPDDRHRGAGGAMIAQTLAQAWSLVARWYSIPLLLLVWQVAVGSGLVESRLLPGPGRVWTALVTEIGNGALVYHASVTISRALTGFVLAALVGIPFAAAMARSVLVRNLFEPIFFIGYPVPKIALFPVFTYIFGIGTPSKIAFTFLECLYPIVVTCYFGFRAVQTRLIWTAQNCGASRATILRASSCRRRCRAFSPGCASRCRWRSSSSSSPR